MGHSRHPFSARPLWALAAFAALAAAVFLYVADPAESPLAPQCPFRRLTGWNCPGCGLQRAAHALLHGHPAEAARQNPFLLAALPYLAALLLTELAWSGERQARWRRVLEGRAAIFSYLFLYVAWGVGRNLAGW